jgi:2-polyprenyl-6-methoxyphenol hydroxylase-like FAD-dependent oxidoreductase
MTAPDPRTALIAGAGIGGLAAGVALRSAGWRVRIHERASSPRELGFGLLLAPNALSALRELGVAAVVEAGAVAATGVEVRRLNGRLIRRLQSADWFACGRGAAIRIARRASDRDRRRTP